MLVGVRVASDHPLFFHSSDQLQQALWTALVLVLYGIGYLTRFKRSYPTLLMQQSMQSSDHCPLNGCSQLTDREGQGHSVLAGAIHEWVQLILPYQCCVATEQISAHTGLTHRLAATQIVSADCDKFPDRHSCDTMPCTISGYH